MSAFVKEDGIIISMKGDNIEEEQGTGIILSIMLPAQLLPEQIQNDILIMQQQRNNRPDT